MQCNVGGYDRLIRALLGILLFAFGMTFGYFILMVIGLIVGLTALFSFCPAYIPLGMNTNHSSE